MKAMKIVLATGALVAVAWASSSGVAYATMDMQKKAKEAGFPATNCQYCHADKMPKKDAHGFNERGKFLMAEKEKAKAAAVDVTWLKNYKEPEAKK
jgi:hypothetical protein